MSWISVHVFTPIKAALQKFVGIITPQVEADLEAFFEAFAQIALGAVLQQVPLVVSGAEKFGTAVTSVIQQAEAKGWAVAVPAAQQLVQQVYNAAALSSGQTLVVPPGASGTVSTGNLTVGPNVASAVALAVKS